MRPPFRLKIMPPLNCPLSWLLQVKVLFLYLLYLLLFLLVLILPPLLHWPLPLHLHLYPQIPFLLPYCPQQTPLLPLHHHSLLCSNLHLCLTLIVLLHLFSPPPLLSSLLHLILACHPLTYLSLSIHLLLLQQFLSPLLPLNHQYLHHSL